MKQFKMVAAHIATLTDGPLKTELSEMLEMANSVLVKMTEVINEFFIKTAVIVTGKKPDQGATIKSLLKDFEKTAKEKGITNIYIDGDITNWFPKEKVSGEIAAPSRLLRFAKDMTHKAIIENAKALNAYQEVSLSDAIVRATQLVAAGELDKTNGTGIIIYLTNRKDDTPCRLGVWRNDDGQLYLNVYHVDLDNEWYAGYGVLVSNENLGD